METYTDPRPRLLVLTDIGDDPDDQQSLARLLVHSNEFQIEAIISLVGLSGSGNVQRRGCRGVCRQTSSTTS